MLTAAYTGDSTITIAEAEPQAPGAGQVQIRVAYIGLCGTDLHILHGNMDARVHDAADLRPRDERHDRRRRRRRRPAGPSATPSPSCRSTGTAPARPASPATSTSARTSTSSASTPPARCRRSGTCRPTRSCALPARHRARRTPRSSNPSPSPCTTCAARSCSPARRPSSSAAVPIGVLIATVARDVRRRGRRDRARRRTAAPRSTALGFATLDPRETDQVAWVERVDRRRRRRRRVRGVRGGRGGARRHRPRQGARHASSSSRSIRRRARSTCSGCSGASCASSVRASTSAPTSRRAVELLADGVIPADRADHPDRAARPRRARPSTTSRPAAR